MDILFTLFASLCLGVSFHALLSFLPKNPASKKLPPGPPTVPIIGNFFWLIKATRNFSNMEPVIRYLRAKHGSIVTLRGGSRHRRARASKCLETALVTLQIGPRPAIFITSHETAHRALVQGGATFADRPPALIINNLLNSNQRTIHSSSYGPIWRALRHNFMSFLHPSKLDSFSRGRKWAIERLKNRLVEESSNGTKAIYMLDHFRYVTYCLLGYICFGEELDDQVLKEIERVQRDILVNLIRYNVLNLMPRLGKIVFRRRWKEVLQKRRDLESVLLPIIKARLEKNVCADHDKPEDSPLVFSYVDTFASLRLPTEKGVLKKMTDDEMVSLCSEFMNGGTDTSTATLQWAMANLVKRQDMQKKLANEINSVVDPGREINEQDLKRMPYLKAMVLETVRRHPPGHFLLPHAVTQDTTFQGYKIPRNALVNFTVAEMGWDEKVWDNPMEFRPERFVHESTGEVEFDLKGVREIKMMPFGAGRRVCPAITVAMMHLEYVVANLIRAFEWRVEDGDEVDMAEIQDFTIVMKNPLRACITPRKY